MSEYTNEYVEEADQWFEHGWRFENNMVYSYTIDRKEQNMQKGHPLTIEEFLNDTRIGIEIKNWLKDIAGDCIVKDNNILNE